MGTSPELRVHPLREILAPRPGMRFHACHTARAASDETDATTRDGGAMDAARFPDPTHDVPRDDRAHDRDDTRARARSSNADDDADTRPSAASASVRRRPIAAAATANVERTATPTSTTATTPDSTRDTTESFAPVVRPSAAPVPTTPKRTSLAICAANSNE